MTVQRYFEIAARDGRASLLYASTPTERGEAEPRAWVARVGPAYVLCTDGEAEDACFETIQASTPISAARVQARRHWARMLYSRRVGRRPRQPIQPTVPDP